MNSKLSIQILSFLFFLFSSMLVYSQELDVDELLERLDRIEKNISDIQKGKIEELEQSLSSGYISRNESKLGDFETKIRKNFGLVEETNNQVENFAEKLDLSDKDLQVRIKEIKKKIKKLEKLKQNQKERDISETLSLPLQKDITKKNL